SFSSRKGGSRSKSKYGRLATVMNAAPSSIVMRKSRRGSPAKNRRMSPQTAEPNERFGRFGLGRSALRCAYHGGAVASRRHRDHRAVVVPGRGALARGGKFPARGPF